MSAAGQDRGRSSARDQAQGEESLTAIESQYASTSPSVPKRIHILGTGSIGKLVAHSLRSLPDPPPVTLVLHRYGLLNAWEKGPKVITLQDNGHDVQRGGFDVELNREVRVEYGRERQAGEPSVYEVSDSIDGKVKPHEAAQIFRDQDVEKTGSKERSETASAHDMYKPFSLGKGDYATSEEPIHNLIITTKTPTTVPALRGLKSRLLPTSTLCFLQNGMGVIDDVNEQLFPDPEERPNYMQGIITHGANVPPQKAEQDPFYAVHAGKGTIALGLLPREGPGAVRADNEAADVKDIKDEKWAPSSRYLLRTLARSPALCAIGFTPTELLQQQLEKLVVNSVLNPLTAILDNRNGSILHNFPLTRTMRLMLAETSHVIRNLPELQSVPNVNTRFGPQRLEDLVVSVTQRTKDNISSMLADVRAGRRTEIEYINGYIVKRGEELGLKCLVNYAIMQTVIGKAVMTRREVHGEVPVEGEGNTGSTLTGEN